MGCRTAWGVAALAGWMVACGGDDGGTKAVADGGQDVATERDASPDGTTPDVVEDIAAPDDVEADTTPEEDTSEPDATPVVPPTWEPGEGSGCAAYSGQGPYEVGVTHVEVDGTKIEIWYPTTAAAVEGVPRDVYDIRDWLPAAEQSKIPADQSPRFVTLAHRDVEAATGSFPVLLFSHGFSGYRMQSTALTTHVASWGFVVASPEHPSRNLTWILGEREPGDDLQELRRALDAVLAADGEAGNRLEGRVDEERVAVSGHSAGGGTTYRFLDQPEIDTWISYASNTSGEPARVLPAMLQAGTRDNIIQASQTKRGYNEQPAPKSYVSIKDAGHLAFSDICLIGRDRGGILKIARDFGVRVPAPLIALGSDGCREDDLLPELAFPIVHHYSVAHLRAAFGIDTGTEHVEDLTGCFGALLEEFDRVDP